MKTIIIGLSYRSSFNFFSKAIQLFQGTPYSHAYIKFHSEEMGRDLIYQASGLTVNFMGSDLFNKKEIVFKEWKISVTDEIYSKVLNFAADEVGKPYSIKAIIGIVFHTLFGWKLFNSDNFNSFICSELVGYIMQIIGIIKDDTNLDYFTPKDVYRVLTQKQEE